LTITGWGQPLVLGTYPNEKYFFPCQSSSISHKDVSCKVKSVNSKFKKKIIFETYTHLDSYYPNQSLDVSKIKGKK
jgi:hypothetical protein